MRRRDCRLAALGEIVDLATTLLVALGVQRGLLLPWYRQSEYDIGRFLVDLVVHGSVIVCW